MSESTTYLPEEFTSLVDELNHLVAYHDVEVTKALWKSDREGLDQIHSEAHRKESTVVIEGITSWLRSKRNDGSPCICCDGPHVFAHRIDLIDPPKSIFYSRNENLTEWIESAIRNAPEGARLRFSVEVIDVPKSKRKRKADSGKKLS